MQWNEIKTNESETGFLYKGEILFDKVFIKAMSFHEEGFAAVQDGSGAYHIDMNGEAAYKERYLETFGFYEGVAAVRDERGFFHIDVKGKALYERRFKWAGNFQGGYCAVEDGLEGFYHINKSGDPLYKERYLYVGDFKYGIAVVYSSKGAFHINAKGEPLYTSRFRRADVFHKGYSAVEDEGGFYHIGKDGKPAYSTRFKFVEPFYNNWAFGEDFRGNKVRIRENGTYVCLPNYLYPLNAEEIRDLCESGAKVGLCIRHAERFDIPDDDPNWGELVPLNERGKEQARLLGRKFGGIETALYSSPVERCRETCEQLSAGIGGIRNNIVVSKVFGSPGSFFDETKKAENDLQQKDFWDFALNYLNSGQAPGMRPLPEGVNILLDYMRDNMSCPLNVFVTHDLFIALVSSFLGLRPVERERWCNYLEGFCLIRRPNGSIEFRAFKADELIKKGEGNG